jgi:molybdopterin converting factor small subunit
VATTITLSNGPLTLQVSVEGEDECATISDAIRQFGAQFNIPAGATPTVNGTPVTEDTELQEGDDVAFTKTAGSKG